MKRENIEIHNAHIRQTNPKPKDVPEAPSESDIQAIIDAYNEAEAMQEGRLAVLYSYCVKNRKHALNFRDPAHRWTNFPRPEGERLDIGMERFVGPFIVYIDSIE